MKKSAIILLFIMLLSTMWAERVEEDLAAKIALGFYAYKSNTAGDISSIQGYPADRATKPDFYVVNFEPTGFVLIAADDRSEPILGYSTDSFFPLEGLPDHVDWFLGEYSKSLAEIRQHPEWDKNLSWDKLSNYDFSDYIVTRDVAPLCATRWDQNWPYNAMCPADGSGPGGRVYAGCVATAMAQIMKRWDHPTTGHGSHSYNAAGYGTQTANFGDTMYEWQNMPNYIYTQNNSIATLIYHCGVSVNMQYSPSGSGAYSIDARNAMVNYFRFHNSASYVTAASYGPSAWENLLISNLDSSRPMIYSGTGNTGGHAFVLDGYQGTSHFHFVWGWGNSYVGYYYLNNLNPGSYNFTSSQAAVLNLYPINQPANDMAAYSIDGEQELALDEQYTFQIGVFNNGPNPQSNYTVQFYVDDTLVGSQAGTTQLLWGQGASFDFNWTPTALGTFTLYGKVVLAGDLNPDNDYTDALEVEVFEEVYTTVQIGGSNLYNTYSGVHTPYGSQSMAYRQQYLITSDELLDAGAGAGSFLSLGFDVRSVNNCPPIPDYKIRLKNTQNSSLSQYFETGYYQTVCEYDEYTPTPGWNEHEFQYPFAWDGVSNIIVDISTGLREPMTTQCSSAYHTYSSFDSCLRFDSNAVAGINGSSGTLGRSRANIRLIYRDAGDEPEIIISPSIIDFGDLNWGETAVVYANLSNIGGGSVELWEGNFAFTGEHAEMFFHSISAYPVSLGSGQSFAFPIFVIADQIGQLSASLVITYGGVEYEAELRCYCIPPAIEQFPFFEGFETYPDFATSFAPWTLIDVDAAHTSGIDSVSFPGSGTPMAFMVFNPQMTLPPLPIVAYEGDKMAAAFASIGVYSNDFLITPRLKLDTNSVVKFHAFSYIPQDQSPSFRLGISTATNPSLVDEYDFFLGEDFLFAPDYWEEFCFDISQYDNQEVYIAIQSSFDHANAFMVDNFSVHCRPYSNDDEIAPALVSRIRGNYPNPFNPTTTISYFLGDASQVKIDVYNLKGQLVKHLVDAEMPSGEHQIVWDGCDDHNRAVSSGVYLLKMNAGKHSSTSKMLMMK